ncbi:MAG: mRNA interferase MqsR [Gemmatimonas sp.]|nr:mRNA interferase MqsR [Gemmatimonas sp.]
MLREPLSLAAQRLAFKIDDICDCILTLESGDFYKTMPARHMPGFWQDVYRPQFGGFALYVKVQIVDNRSVVISFKER